MENKKAILLAMLLALAFLLRLQPIYFSGYGDPDTFFHQRNIETFVSQHRAFFSYKETIIFDYNCARMDKVLYATAQKYSGSTD